MKELTPDSNQHCYEGSQKLMKEYFAYERQGLFSCSGSSNKSGICLSNGVLDYRELVVDEERESS